LVKKFRSAPGFESSSAEAFLFDEEVGCSFMGGCFQATIFPALASCLF
jgi:hypothetical protein